MKNLLPKKSFLAVTILVFCFIFVFSISTECGAKKKAKKDAAYEEYIDFFEEVYDVVDKNYYQQPNRQDFDRFLEKFDKEIYAQLKKTGKSNDYIRWRSTALLIDALKTPEDIFSAFYPPKPAKEYEQTALGKNIDLGIEGKLINVGYEVTFVEPRSDAYEKGLRNYDLITKINEQNVLDLDETKIKELLTPLMDTFTQIAFISAETKQGHAISVESKEYFKETVFPIQMNVPGIYGFEIQRFNRKTGEDVFRFMKYFKDLGGIKGMIIDLRNNPGGPPLAARELASFFLPEGEEFAYFQKRGEEKAALDVPAIPKEYKFDGPVVILVNEKSGSASELFSGIMQRKGRAVLMGQNSAGQVMLKSMFNFKDDSMVLLITARGHYPDGSVFSFGGLVPDERILPDQEDEILKYATMYLLYQNKKDERQEVRD